jgi:hypothetical protein
MLPVQIRITIFMITELSQHNFLTALSAFSVHPQPEELEQRQFGSLSWLEHGPTNFLVSRRSLCAVGTGFRLYDWNGMQKGRS